MDIVVMPGHMRPEMFKVWLGLVKKANGASELFYLFCLDSGFDERYMDLMYEFPYEYSYIEMTPSELTLGKQSRNVLNGMVAAAQHSDDLVYYVEEDIFIGVDFFRWHKEIHKKEKDIFCSIGTKANDSRYKLDGFHNHYYVTKEPDYQSWGSCFKKEIILDLIYPHFNDRYLYDPTGYCMRNFPLASIGSRFTEQDGLIKRILEQKKMTVAYPCLPYAYHSGFYGYNRQAQIMKKPYEEKLKMVREICFDKELMKKWSAPFTDSVPVELDLTFNTLRKVETFKI
jgi:hypothetical protein